MGWGREGEGSGLGGQGGCDRRKKVFGKIHKKKNFRGGGVGLGGGGWVRVDVNKELKFWCKFKKKKKNWGGGGVRGVGLGGGVKVDENEELKFL